MGWWDDGDSWGDTKGWDRASITYRSRTSYHPEIAAEDLRLPNEASKLRSFAICTFAAAILTVTFGSIPLFYLNIWMPLGAWYGAILLSVFVVLALAFSIISAFETKSLRQLAREL